MRVHAAIALLGVACCLTSNVTRATPIHPRTVPVANQGFTYPAKIEHKQEALEFMSLIGVNKPMVWWLDFTEYGVKLAA